VRSYFFKILQEKTLELESLLNHEDSSAKSLRDIVSTVLMVRKILNERKILPASGEGMRYLNRIQHFLEKKSLLERELDFQNRLKDAFPQAHPLINLADTGILKELDQLTIDLEKLRQKLKAPMILFKLRNIPENRLNPDADETLAHYAARLTLQWLYPIHLQLADSSGKIESVSLKQLLPALTELNCFSRTLQWLNPPQWEGEFAESAALLERTEGLAAAENYLKRIRVFAMKATPNLNRLMSQEQLFDETDSVLWAEWRELHLLWDPEFFQKASDLYNEKKYLWLELWEKAEEDKLWRRFYNHTLE
jgi:hypothetical protein